MSTAPARAPRPLLEALKKTGKFKILVETGTAAGDSALAAGDLFDTVITLEADPALAEAAHERLSGRKGILPLAGDSRELLPRLLPRLAGPAVFWLDAHACGPGSYGCEDSSPLLEEIAAIVDAPQPHVILIGEAGKLAGPTPQETAHWPAQSAVLAALGADLERDVARVEDVLVAIPRSSAALWEALFPQGRPAFLTPSQA